MKMVSSVIVVVASVFPLAMGMEPLPSLRRTEGGPIRRGAPSPAFPVGTRVEILTENRKGTGIVADRSKAGTYHSEFRSEFRGDASRPQSDGGKSDLFVTLDSGKCRWVPVTELKALPGAGLAVLSAAAKTGKSDPGASEGMMGIAALNVVATECKCSGSETFSTLHPIQQQLKEWKLPCPCKKDKSGRCPNARAEGSQYCSRCTLGKKCKNDHKRTFFSNQKNCKVTVSTGDRSVYKDSLCRECFKKEKRGDEPSATDLLESNPSEDLVATVEHTRRGEGSSSEPYTNVQVNPQE